MENSYLYYELETLDRWQTLLQEAESERMSRRFSSAGRTAGMLRRVGRWFARTMILAGQGLLARCECPEALCLERGK